MKLFWVGIGGLAGSMLRYLLSGWVQQSSGSVSFPYGTLAVNVLGCLLVGALSYLADERGLLHPQARLLLIVGMLGGFTTFSAFGNETLALMRASEFLSASANVLLNVLLCLIAVWLGRSAAFWIWR